jgi:hypothetical protein
VPTLLARIAVDALVMKLPVDRVGAYLIGMDLAPQPAEVDVVLTAAECAGSVAGGERGGVEEEELGEAARLKEPAPTPAAKLELTGDPTLAV